MNVDDVRSLLSDRCADIGGLRLWARAHKVSAPYVSRVIAGHMLPGEKILKALGLVKRVDYRKRNGSA